MTITPRYSDSKLRIVLNINTSTRGEFPARFLLKQTIGGVTEELADTYPPASSNRQRSSVGSLVTLQDYGVCTSTIEVIAFNSGVGSTNPITIFPCYSMREEASGDSDAILNRSYNSVNSDRNTLTISSLFVAVWKT